ncbi:zinc ribbon domain-containing protein [Neobacillus sp. Marseille-QA0830]
MSFCKECGASLASGTAFCKECGKPVEREANIPPSAPKSGQPMNPRTKKLLIAGVVVLGVLFGGYKAGENLTSKDRKIEKVETALIEKDQDKLASLLVSTDKKLEIDQDSLKGLMKFLEENPDRVQDIVETLKSQSKYYDSVKSDSKNSQSYIEETMDSGLFNLRKNGKTLFYDKYEITIKPVYMSLATNYEKTELKVNGKKVATANKNNFSKTVGPFVPGYYTVEASLKNDYVTLKNKQNVLLTGGDKQEVDAYLEGKDVTLYSDIDDSGLKGKVLLNGKELKVNPFSEQSFGPILTDGSLKLQVVAQLPWGETKSNEIKIDDTEVEFDLSQDKNLQKSITDTLVLNAQEWMQAYTSGDMSKFTTQTADQNEEMQSEIDSAKESGRLFQGKYLGTTFDLDSLSLYQDDDQWKVRVNAEEYYNSDYYNAGETPELSDDSVDWTYYLVYDPDKKKWLVEDHSNSYGFDEDSENLYESKEENPKQYTTAWAN